jgi:hypothetical protein
MGPRKQAAATSSAAQTAGAAPAAAPAAAARPALPSNVEEAFLPVNGATTAIIYRPRVLGLARLHYVDKSAGIDEWQSLALAAAISDDGRDALWSEADETTAAVTREPVAGAGFAEIPAAAQRAAAYGEWGKALATQLYQDRALQVLACDALKQTSRAGESEGDFRARLTLTVREQRDAEAGKLRQKFAPKLTTLQGQRQRALERVEREKGQASQQKLHAAISLGTSILGAFLGRRVLSSSNVGRMGTAARSASRIGRESADVERAEGSVEQIDQRIADLDKELESAIAALDMRLDARNIELRKVTIAPRKSDIGVGKVMLLWTPWRIGSDGLPASAA